MENPSDRILMQVQAQNWRDHGGNGEVDPEVMKDMGFSTFEEVGQTIETRRHFKEQLAGILGSTSLKTETTVPSPEDSTPRIGQSRLYERPDRIRANSPKSLTPAEAQKGLDPGAIARQQAINRIGAESARQAIRDFLRSDKSPKN